MPDAPVSTASAKTEFSGPGDLLALAHKVADPKGSFDAGGKWIVGERGAWSEWLCLAMKEKLVRDGHWPTETSEIKAEILGAAEEIGFPAALEALRRKLRTKASAA